MKYLWIAFLIGAISLFAVQIKDVSFNSGGGTIEGVDHKLNAAIGENAVGSTENESTKLNSGYIAIIARNDAISEHYSELPDVFKIISANPNPFNSKCRIDFDVTETKDIDISIFSVNGSKMLSTSFLCKAGVNSVVWNAADAESGIYLFMISNGQNKETKKLILIK